MTTPTRPFIDCEQQHASVFVSDLAAAIDFYTQKLGFTLAFTWGDPPRLAALLQDLATPRHRLRQPRQLPVH